MKYQNTTLEDFSLYSVEKDFDISKLDEISSLLDTVEGTKFNDVKKPAASDKANYVLQHDTRYRKVWGNYLKILKMKITLFFLFVIFHV